MKQLHNDVKEAINLIVRQGDEAIYIEKIDKTKKFAYILELAEEVLCMLVLVLVSFFFFFVLRFVQYIWSWSN